MNANVLDPVVMLSKSTRPPVWVRLPLKFRPPAPTNKVALLRAVVPTTLPVPPNVPPVTLMWFATMVPPLIAVDSAACVNVFRAVKLLWASTVRLLLLAKLPLFVVLPVACVNLLPP